MRLCRVRALFLSFAVSAHALSMVGCIADPDDARMDVPGEYLGSYQVEAVLLDSTCGAGTLEAPNLWDFEVQLSKDERHLYWTNGAESIQGQLSSDGTTFGFTTEVATTLKEEKPGRPGCVVWRQDSATGELILASGQDDVPSFNARLTYTYAPGAGSACDEVLDESGLTQLPCIIRYELKGARQEEAH